MGTEMYPIMEVEISFIDRKPQYELTLSRANFNHLCAGCPDFDRIVGHAENGAMFYIFENPYGEMPNSFRPLSEEGIYYAYIGTSVPSLPQGINNDEFSRFAQQAYDNLERAINESSRIPIEKETSSGKINLGYVVMNVEKE
ncbi:MAG: hypothetical protein ACOCP4_06260 [Candidatus Woesearchaeota archaeon]